MTQRRWWAAAGLWFGYGYVFLALVAAFSLQNQAAAQRSAPPRRASSVVSDYRLARAQQPATQTDKAQHAGPVTANPPTSAQAAGVPVLSSGDSYDDFASMAQTSDGTIYAAYAAYYDGHDQIRLHKQHPDGGWTPRVYVPLVEAEADIWMPQLAVDARDRLWVIWGEQTGRTPTRSGNWDIYARPRIGDRWGQIVRLTDDPKPDINHHVTTDANGNIYVVWQAHPKNNGDVQLCRYDGVKWSKPIAVTSDRFSDWYPRVAVDSRGRAWVVFDSYRTGDYDIYIAYVDGDYVSSEVAVTNSLYYEAHPSVACTSDNKVWVAWEQGGYLWGKDQGHWLQWQNRNVGSTLGNGRTIQVAEVDYDNVAFKSAPSLAQAMPEGQQRYLAMAGLTSDQQGRLWLRFRHRKLFPQRNRGRGYWTENVTYLTPDGWQTPVELAGSTGRISVFSRELAAADGSLYVAYSSDLRRPSNFHQPQHDQVLVARIDQPDEAAGAPELVAYESPAAPENAGNWNLQREISQVERIRDHRVTINGREHHIVRGDLHRHTELSWDVGPGNDGSYLDFYRYMIDVAEMDFGGLSDHQGGGHYAYWWWLTEKSCDMYYLPPRYVPLYGYERSARFPDGHRNIFHSTRGVPVFPFQTTLNVNANVRLPSAVFPGVAASVIDNDTKLLYEYLHKTGGIAISHTSGTTTMGTNWRDNDPEVEPVVEIYQGARNSYETLGGPRVHLSDPKGPERSPGLFQQEGLVSNALAKGYRLGTITSSDHGSTHISYALVYTPKSDRESIIESIRRRQTYGATDNLIIEAEANGHFMGQEFTSSELPSLSLRVRGTGAIARVDLFRNNRLVYSNSPNIARTEVAFTDMDPAVGLNYYYFRIVQENGEVAWASPMWINYVSQ